MPAQVAVPGALVAGVPGVLLGTLEAFPGGVVLLPGILGHGAGVFPALPRKQIPKVSTGGLGEGEREKGSKEREGGGGGTKQGGEAGKVEHAFASLDQRC